MSELAGSTGLEPAASGVTGRRSNQLNYDPVFVEVRSAKFEVRTKFELLQTSHFELPTSILVGGTGFEPVTAGV